MSQHLNLEHKSFVLVHNLHDEIFFPVIQYLIVAFCTCYTEPHLSLTCPRTSQNTKQYHSWTTNHEKLWMICDLLTLRPISHITQKTLSFLHSTRIEQITKTMVLVLKQAPLFFAAFAAIQYYHKLPSSGSRILATLPLVVSAHTFYISFFRKFYATTRCAENDNYMSEQVWHRELICFLWIS